MYFDSVSSSQRCRQFASFKIFNISKDLDNVAVKLSASLAPNLVQTYLDLCLDLKLFGFQTKVESRVETRSRF